MAKSRKFDELRKGITPAQRKRIDAKKQELLEEMALHEIRKLLGFSQVELAESLDVRQSSISQMENQDDITVSTLAKIIGALGGNLEIIAEFPHQKKRFKITQFGNAA